MTNIVTRTLTGIVFITIIIGSIIISKYLFMIVFAFVNILALKEFYQLAEKDGISLQKYNGIVTGSILYLSLSLFSFGDIEFRWLLINFFTVVLIFIEELYRKKQQPIANIAITIFSIIYISIPLSLLNFFFSPFQFAGDSNIQVLLAFFILTWVIDTFAYLSGMAFGKNRLFESVSPKKTWEGSIGGFISGIGAAFVLSVFFKDLVFYQWAIIAVIIAVAGGFGDLVESMFKRSTQIKDTGSILPGHGGILDRFDCIFLSAPIVFVYLYFLSNKL